MTRTLIIVLAVVALGASAVAGIFFHNRGGKTPTTLPADSYTASASKGEITQIVAATGPVASNLDVLIKCRASGEVITLPFDISDRVKKGDLLVQLDQKDEKVILDQAKVTLAQALSKLKEAEANERMAELDLVNGDGAGGFQHRCRRGQGHQPPPQGRPAKAVADADAGLAGGL